MGGRGEGKDEVCSGGCVGAGGEWGVGECWVQGGVGRDGRVACWGGVKWSGVELGEVVRAWGGSLYGEGWGDGMSREGGCLKACGREDGGVLRRGRVDLGACVTLQWGGAVLWALREEGRVVRGTGGVMSRGLGEEAVEWRRSLGGEVGDDNETGPEGGGGGWVEVSCTGVRGAVFWCAGDGWWDVLVLRRVARWCSGGERLQISLLAGCGGGGTYRVGVGMKWVGEMAGGLGWTFGVGGWGGVWGTWVRVTGVLVVKCGGGGGGATGSWGEWERSGGGWGVGKFGVAEGEEGEKGGGWGGVADGGTVSVVEVESWVRGDECCVLWGVWVVKWGGGGEGGVADWRGGGGWAGRGWGCKGMRVRGRVGGGCGWGNGKGVGGDGRESGSGGVEGVGGWFEGEGGRAWDWAVGGDGGGRWEGEALGGVTEGAVDWGVEAVGVGRERWIGGESRVIQAVKLGVRAEGEGWGGGSAEEYLGCGLVGGGDVVGGGGDGGRGLGVGGWGVTYGVELVEVGAGEGGSVGWRWGRELRCGGNHLTLVKGNQFDGRTKTDPHRHIHEFLRICDMFKYKDTENEAIRLMMFSLSLTGEAKTCEITQEVLNAATGGIFLYKTPNQAYHLLEDKVLLKLDWAKSQKTKSSIKKTVAFADEGSSNSNTDKIIARMDAMTLKMDAQYKELQSRAKKTKPDLD
ncbi:hypothetical protein Tco_1214893 [Tanacetum coccineum]